MAYATVQSIKDRIRAQELQLLTDLDGTAGAPVDAVIEAALEDATAEVNGWIAKRVTLPLDPVPQMLEVVTRDLARVRLYQDAGRVTDDMQRQRDNALKYLAAVAKGEVSLGDETAADTETISPGPVIEDGPDAIFSRTTLKGF